MNKWNEQASFALVEALFESELLSENEYRTASEFIERGEIYRALEYALNSRETS